MRDEIRLPRSGVVLTLSRDGKRHEAQIVGERVVLARHFQGYWRAWCFGRDFEHDSRETVVAQLDGFLANLRAALMPEDARERVAKVLCDERRGIDGPSLDELGLAETILKALSVEPKGGAEGAA